jgi:hypothetical protein
VKHVFVETNFLVDLLRPFPKRDAESLFSRISVDITMYIPWVSVSEAKRTLNSKIVNEDLGFANLMQQFGVALLKKNSISNKDMQCIQLLENHIKTERAYRLKSVDNDVNNAIGKMIVIPPSQGVIDKTISLYPVKYLPPFDEMVLGAVLFHAQSLAAAGEKDLFFCNANSKDFGPSSGNTLAAAYASCSLIYLDKFIVP